MREWPIEDLYRAVADLPPDAPLPLDPERCDPPFVPLREVSQDAEITRLDEPFIYRNFPWLPAGEDFFSTHLQTDPAVWGYRSSPKDNDSDWNDATLTGREVWTQFCAGTLSMNIVDSQCGEMKPVLAGWDSERLRRPPSIGWVLTSAPQVTFFHTDPPYGDCFQYIARGEKLWVLFPPQELESIRARHGFEIINSVPLAELVRMDDSLLWGKIGIGRIGDGDLLFFPENWPHFVRTLRSSFGFGGYFGHEGDDEEEWDFWKK